jgi:F-type H+-transporting ATPase subunit a
MVVTWAVAIGLIVFAQVATRKVRDVPEGAQNFWEWMVESLFQFLEGIIGHELVKKTFWFFATSSSSSSLPTGWPHPRRRAPSAGAFEGPRFSGDGTALRGANADLNMTLGMAMIFFVCWTIWAFQANGPMGFIMHLFGPKGETTGVLKILMVDGVHRWSGLLEVVSILFRPVSLSFRLYGNIFAGENMLESMARLVPGWAGHVIPMPFYFMEMLVGFVQALVFMLLTAVFTLLICT